MKVKIKLTGEKPMLQHNIRLANPFDKYAKEMKRLSSIRNKTDEILAQMMQVECRGSYYESTNGNIGLPTRNVAACLKKAAKSMKLGQRMDAAITYDDSSPEVLINGKAMTPEKHMENSDNWLCVAVRVKNNRVMRTRPKIANWSTEHEFELNESVLNKQELGEIVKTAQRIGVAEWPQLYGKFKAEIKEIK